MPQSTLDEKRLPLPHALSLVYPDPEANEEHIQKSIAGSLGIPQTLVFHEQAVEADHLFTASLKVNARGLIRWLWACRRSTSRLATGRERQGVTSSFRARGATSGWILTMNLRRTLCARWTSQACCASRRRSGPPAVIRGTALRRTPPLVERITTSSNESVASAQRWAAPEVSRARLRRSAQQTIPSWLAPDPELRKNLYERAEKSAQKINGSFYRQKIFSRNSQPSFNGMVQGRQFREQPAHRRPHARAVL